MPDNGVPLDRKVSRRNLLKGTAAGSTILLAGCSSDDTEDVTIGDSDTSSGEKDSSDSDLSSTDSDDSSGRTFIASEQVATDEAQYNPFNARNRTENVETLLYQSLAKFSPQEGEFRPQLASDWSISSNEATVTLRDDVTWTTGDPVTADDLLTRLHLGSYFDFGLWDFVEDVSKEGTNTVTLAIDGDVNEEALKHQLLSVRVSTPTSLYQEYLDNLEAASGDAEIDAAKEELISWTLREPPSNGPVEWVSATPNKVVMEVREEGHPAISDLNFETVEWQAVEHQQGVAMLTNHQMDDFTGLVTGEIADRYPDWVTLTRFPVFYGMTLTLNFNHEALANRQVRQAIAHVANRTTTTNNSSSVMYSAVEVPTAIPGTLSGLDEQYLGDTYDSFSTYGYDGSNTDEATSLMQEAGYEMSDGQWVDTSGEPVEFKVMAPANWSWVRSGQTVTSLLEDFGFAVEYVTQEASVLYGTTQPNGDYDIITGDWGTYNPHPSTSFKTAIGLDQPQVKENAAIPSTLDVPMPVGDPDGAIESIDIESKIDELSASSGETATQLVQEIAWAVNQGLPKIIVNEKLDQRSFDSTEWEIPAADSPELGVPYLEEFLFNQGLIQAKSQN